MMKPFGNSDKMAAVELWKARVPLRNIIDQLGMSKASWKRAQDEKL
jgi:hypothetical protein